MFVIIMALGATSADLAHFGLNLFLGQLPMHNPSILTVVRWMYGTATHALLFLLEERMGVSSSGRTYG